MKSGLVINNGDKYWYINDDLNHVEYSHGTKIWLKNNKFHRLDGPAIEWDYGNKDWYISGVKYTKEEFEKTVLMMKLSGLI